MRKNDSVIITLKKEGELILLDALITGASNRIGLTRTKPYDKKTLIVLSTPYQIDELLDFVENLKKYFDIESIEVL